MPFREQYFKFFPWIDFSRLIRFYRLEIDPNPCPERDIFKIRPFLNIYHLLYFFQLSDQVLIMPASENDEFLTFVMKAGSDY